MEDVIFVGNDINLEASYSWSDLMVELRNEAGVHKLDILMEGKPFPLLYEELVSLGKAIGKSDIGFKEFISDRIIRFKENTIHQRIVKSQIKDIITTNYDFSFENCVTKNFKNLSNNGIVKERKYSLFRHFELDSKRIWHCQGDPTVPNSITLGYEHYSGYLQQMRNYVVSGTTTAYKKEFDSLVSRLKKGNITSDSWIDLFITSDVHIFGIGLDFTEIHFWWLIAFRNQLSVNSSYVGGDLYYYYPDSFRKKSEIKLEVMKNLGVKLVPISGTNYSKNNKLPYYEKVLDQVLIN